MICKTTVSKYIICCIWAFLPCSVLPQTGIIVYQHDDTEQTFSISQEGKLYFSGTSLLIDEGDGNPQSFEINNVRKIMFESTSTSTLQPSAGNDIIIYPNPATDYISLGNIQNDVVKVKILSISGKLMLNGVYGSEQLIDISALNSGIYLVQVNNKTLKFIKL